MKKVILFLGFVVLMNVLYAQPNTKHWNGTIGNNWSDGSKWLPAGIPAATDTVVFSSGNPCNLDISPTIASLRAMGGAGGGGSIVNSTPQTITINNNSDPSPVLFVAALTNLTIGNGGIGIAITTYGGGSVINNAQIQGSLNLASASSWTISNGSSITNVDISGTVGAYAHTGPLFVGSTISTLRFQSGSSLLWAVGTDGGIIPDADYQDGSTINITGITSTMVAFSGSSNYNGLVIWNCASQTITLSGALATLLPLSSMSMDSIRVMNTGAGTLRLATQPNGYSIGQLEVQGGTLEMGAPIIASGTGTIRTDLKVTGGTLIGNATYTGDGATATPLTITVNGYLTITGGVFNLTNRSTVVGSTGAFQLIATSNVQQIAGSITASSDFSPLNYISLNGSLVVQDLSMVTFSGPIQLIINNPLGVTLSSNLSIPAAPAALNLTSGILTPIGTNLLTMEAGSQVLNASNTSFVNGKVKKVGNTAFVFPVGKAVTGFTGYVPIEITNPMLTIATDSYTAEYIRTSAYSLGAITATGLETITGLEFFMLNRTVTDPLSTMDVTLHWTAETSSNGSPGFIGPLSMPALVVAHYGGASWDSYGTTSTATGTPTSGKVVWSTPAPSAYGPFAIGSIDFANPLPINLNYLNGTKQSNNNYLNWQVTCGANNSSATMSLERSADGRNFGSVTTITADAVRCQQPFDYTDKLPLYGMNYYRLKMTDVNGKVTYSSIIAILNKASGFDIIGLMPTLVTNTAILNVTAAQKTKMDVVVTDITGKQVQKIAYNLIAGSNQFTMNLENLAAGTYQINGYTTDGKSRTIRFVKQ